MNWLCRLGFHRWATRIVGLYSTKMRYDYMRCVRPGCRYEEWHLVNAEEIKIGAVRPSSEADEKRPRND